MQLKIKNKHFLALHHLIEKSDRAGAIPSHLEFHPKEGYELLCEINQLYNDKKELIKDISIEQMQGWFEDGQFDPEVIPNDVRLTLYAKTPLSRKDGEDLVKRWYAGELKI